MPPRHNAQRDTVLLLPFPSVRLSVRLPVCLSNAGSVSKRKHISSNIYDIRVGTSLHCALSLALQCTVIGPVYLFV